MFVNELAKLRQSLNDDYNLTDGDILILGGIIETYNNFKSYKYSYDTIARHWCMSKRSVMNTIKKLNDYGLIEIKRKRIDDKYETNEYIPSETVVKNLHHKDSSSEKFALHGSEKSAPGGSENFAQYNNYSLKENNNNYYNKNVDDNSGPVNDDNLEYLTLMSSATNITELNKYKNLYLAKGTISNDVMKIYIKRYNELKGKTTQNNVDEG